MPVAIEGLTILLVVYDVPTSLAFYRDALGFEVINTSPPFSDAKDDFGWCLLRRNGVELMLNNAYENNIRPAQRDEARSAAHRDTILYFACPELDAAYRYLLSRGIAAPEPSITYYNMLQMTVRDPDGYAVCFQWPAASEC